MKITKCTLHKNNYGLVITNNNENQCFANYNPSEVSTFERTMKQFNTDDVSNVILKQPYQF